MKPSSLDPYTFGRAMDQSERKLKVEVFGMNSGEAKKSTSHHQSVAHKHHRLEKSNTSNTVVDRREVVNSVKAADSLLPSGTVETKRMAESRDSGAPFESPPNPYRTRLTVDDPPSSSYPHWLSTPSLAMMAIADEEAPDVISHDREVSSNEEPGDDARHSLPVASQVPTPPELLERVHKLEERQRVAGEAVPVDMEEQLRLEGDIRRKQCWTIAGCIVLVVATLGIVLGLTLGRKSPPSPTPGTVAPSPSPTSESFSLLKALIESVSFDGGAALSDPLSPQYKALTWLESNQNLEKYPEWKTIQRYALAVLYYSTDGENWTNRDGWLTDNDECTWYSDSLDPVCAESGEFLRLVLYGNNLVGSIPPEVALLSDSLLSLRFKDEHMLNGTIPTELGLLTNLAFFYFVNTALSGTIPSELGRLTQVHLMSFFLQEALLNGSIPLEIVMLPGVEQLSLGDNNLTGVIPTEIGMATNLRGLGLFRTHLEGSIPTELGKLSQLEQLYLNSNKLNGTIPSEVGLLTNVDDIELHENFLSGYLPTEIGLLTKLTILYLSTNRGIQGPVPSELGNLSKLLLLGLEDLALSGTIPNELANLSSVERLYFNNNRLTGTIPTQLGLLRGLLQLRLFNNSLIATIPTELGNLGSLVDLWLEDNTLNGTWPRELTQLTKLEFLALDGNAIIGSLPTAIGNWTKLQLMSFAGNAITGTIPTEIGLLKSLSEYK